MIIVDVFSSANKVCYDHSHLSSKALLEWVLQTHAQGCSPVTNDTHHLMHCPDCMHIAAEVWIALIAGGTRTAHTIPQPDISFLPSIGATFDE